EGERESMTLERVEEVEQTFVGVKLAVEPSHLLVAGEWTERDLRVSHDEGLDERIDPVRARELPAFVVDPDAYLAILDRLKEFRPVWLAQHRRIVRQRDLIQTALRQPSDVVSHHLRSTRKDCFLTAQRQMRFLGATAEATVHVAAPSGTQP